MGSKAATRATRGRTVVKPSGTARTVIASIQQAGWERRREIAGLTVMAATAFALLALVGFHPDDPTALRPVLDPEAKVSNFCGPWGANLADVLYTGFGYGAYAIAVPGLVAPVFAMARRPFLSLLQWVVSAWLWAMTLAGVHLAVEGVPGPEEATAVFTAGGLLGAWLATSLVGVIGVAGAWIVLVTTVLSTSTLVLGFSWSAVARAVVQRIEAELPVVRARAKAAGGTVGGWLVAGLRSAARLVVLGLVWIGNAVLAAITGVGRTLVDVVRRATASLTRDETEIDASEWRDLTGLEPLEASAPVPPSLPEIPGGMPAVADDPTIPTAEVSWVRDDELEETGSAQRLFDDVAPRTRRASDPGSTCVGTAPPTLVRNSEPGDVVLPPSSLPPPRPVRRPARAEAEAEPVRRPETRPAPAAVPSFADEEDDDVRPTPVPIDPYDDVDEDDEPSDATAAPVSRPVPRPAAAVAASREELHVEPVEGLESRAQDDGRSVAERRSRSFELPTLSLLDPIPEQRAQIDKEELAELARTVEEALASFKVTGKVTNVRVGPVVTIFEFLPDPGIKVRRVSNLADDLALALRARSVRIVAPIPGKGVVGIEIPSKHRLTIYLRELLASDEFRNSDAQLPVVLGKDTEGRPVVDDIAKMPHVLVGGTTGSGKSVGVNGMLLSLLFTRTPEELRLLLIDPKKLEFGAYEGVPHLLHPVVIEPDKAAAALAWACREMDRRNELLKTFSARNLENFNRKLERELKSWTTEKAWQYAPKDWSYPEPPQPPEPLPYLVIVIDELADLMMTAKKEVQDSIVRLAQMGRACGIHLIVATQRPSVDVVTGLIKANMPTRVSFKLRSVVDSRTILDQGGAEKLLGRGDMLLLPGAGEVRRVHGPFVSDDEVVRVIDFLRAQRAPEYVHDVTQGAASGSSSDPDAVFDDPEMQDDLYDQALEIVLEKGKASTSMIQRHLKIGYNRAARILDAMEAAGVVGPADGARPRDVLIGPHAG